MAGLLFDANRIAILHRPGCPHPNVCRRFVERRRHTRYGFSGRLEREVDRGPLQYPQVWVSEVEVEVEVDWEVEGEEYIYPQLNPPPRPLSVNPPEL